MVTRKNEVGFTICRAKSGKLTHGPMATGSPTGVNIPVSCPPGSRMEGLFHTHPKGVAYPSDIDIRSAVKVGAKALCVQSDTELACFRITRR